MFSSIFQLLDNLVCVIFQHKIKNKMSAVALTNLLIGLVIGLISFVSKRLIDKIDSFEKSVQSILMNDVAVKKDIEKIKEDVVDHEIRISNLEK